ncbi:amidase [Acidisphaera rubrifaciens]|uniref:Amidase n=1 Tax=Acidisphaera rubrifaciens HS-AP3 TaxID=1231350 RepID=A0A0D6P3R1_9PROT|nr:amidase [Acidisphaera rubrifaciens]GAN75981.1 amidase [Acidisphaera rubrifaciens HS-AP3]
MSTSGFTLPEATIDAIHAAYRSGTLTCEALVRAYLDRIAAYDQQGPALNAFAALNPEALAQARALDAAFARDGRFVGPLHGIPVAVKDQAETAGIPTCFGSVALKGYVPTEDSTVAAKLKAAGAIIIGKTTLPDFATSWFGYASATGETKNPYDLARDPGGSSAGTGAAIAANLATVGIGEDTGGSIRLPSSFCNLVGVRVTPGLISRNGLSPLVVFQDTAGPMARTVRDAALLLDAVVGFDPKDPYTTAHTIAGHKGSYADACDAGALSGARIGVLKEAFGSDDDPDCAQVNAVVRGAIGAMEAAGATIVEISLPNLMEYVVETSLYITHSRHDINAFLAARPQLAYHSLDDIVRDGKYHPKLDLIDDIMTGPAQPEDDPQYYRKLAAREAFQRAVVMLVAANGLDGVCFPCSQVLPPTRKELNDGRWTVLGFPTNTLIAAQTWMPSICVPAGFTPDGIPVGMEIIVPPYHEPDLFRLGYAFEQVAPHRRPPASTPAL